MRVSSPIGELPFEPQKLRYHDRGLEVQGVMGAWPAQVQIGLDDLPALARMLAKPAAALAAPTLVGLLVWTRRRRHPK